MISLEETEQFRQLWNTKQNNRLPHALLFVGVKGTHKAKLAECFSRALLCQQITPQGGSCRQCHSCSLIAGRVHPNLLWIEPEKEGAAIKVDQVRTIGDFINQTSLKSGYRIVIIHPADDMNINAANALLKTLEEPTPESLLILISDQNGRLPATVLSRCQRIVFPRPDKEKTLAWLAEQSSRQNLFQALMLLATGQGDPIKLASELQNNDAIQLLDFLLSWIVDLLRLQLNSETSELINSDFSSQLKDLKQKTHLQKNVKLMEYVQQLRAQICEGINFNKQLMLESIFIQWMELYS